MFDAKRMRALALITIISAVFPSVEALAQNLLPNGSFDTNIDGWTLSNGEPETSMTWEGANGSPAPGSLRIASTLVPAQGTTIEAFSECLNTIPNEILSASALVLKPDAQFGLTCFATLVLYEGLDCTGNRTITGNVPPNMAGVWEESGLIANVTGFSSTRVSLSMSLLGARAGEKVCLFDTASLVSNLRGGTVTDVPTLSWRGGLILALLVTMIALSSMRRFRSRLIHQSKSDLELGGRHRSG